MDQPVARQRSLRLPVARDRAVVAALPPGSRSWCGRARATMPQLGRRSARLSAPSAPSVRGATRPRSPAIAQPRPNRTAAARRRRARAERARPVSAAPIELAGNGAHDAGGRQPPRPHSRASRCCSTCRPSTRSPTSSATFSTASWRSRRRRGRRIEREARVVRALSRSRLGAAERWRTWRAGSICSSKAPGRPTSTASCCRRCRGCARVGHGRRAARVAARLPGEHRRARANQLEQAGMPGIVESFVDRRQLLLGRRDGAVLCAAPRGSGVRRSSAASRSACSTAKARSSWSRPATPRTTSSGTTRTRSASTCRRRGCARRRTRRCCRARHRAAEAGAHHLRAGAGRAALPHRRPVDARPRHRDRSAAPRPAALSRPIDDAPAPSAVPAARLRRDARAADAAIARRRPRAPSGANGGMS